MKRVAPGGSYEHGYSRGPYKEGIAPGGSYEEGPPLLQRGS